MAGIAQAERGGMIWAKNAIGRVVALGRAGKTSFEISQKTGMTEGEVDILLRENATADDVALRRAARSVPRFTDDPRACRPDYQRLPMRPASHVPSGCTLGLVSGGERPASGPVAVTARAAHRIGTTLDEYQRRRAAGQKWCCA